MRNGERRSALLDEISKVLHPNWLPALSYRAVEIAYTKCDAWMGEMLAVLNENKEMLVQFLNERLRKYGLWKWRGLISNGLISGLTAGISKSRSGLCSRKPSFSLTKDTALEKRGKDLNG